jgi:DNA-binding GntR family transcriptional regulator
MVRGTLADAIGSTVRQRSLRELRDRILTGALRAGTRLDLDAISGEFGVSRTPVREALLELSFQGLVEIAPRSGITVVGITPGESMDNFAILAALSGKAAEWAALRITPGALEELSRRSEDLAAAAAARGADLIEANWRFHKAVNQAAGSRRLLSLIHQAVRLIPSNFLAVIPVRTHDGSEHEQLMNHIRSGDAAAARTVAEQHVLAAGESLAMWLADQSAALDGDNDA